MRDRITIVGAGLAGATAAALLKEKYDVLVYEQRAQIGGMLFDEDGLQWYGAHIFYADSQEVWDFLTRFTAFGAYEHHVHVLSEPAFIQELPRRPGDDPVYRVYSEKAWGCPFESLPEDVRRRVPPVCTDGRTGYHAGRFKGQPVKGYSAMIRAMFDGVEVRTGTTIAPDAIRDPLIWTGNISDYAGTAFPWIGRSWEYHEGSLPYTVVNYATHAVLPIRSVDCAKINPYFARPGVMSEYRSNEIPCYPSPDERIRSAARLIVEQAKQENHWLCGRMGAYQYFSMEETVLNVMATIRVSGLL